MAPRLPVVAPARLDQLKARELMIRESASLFGRVVPITGAGRYNTAVVYGTNNTTYYAP